MRVLHVVESTTAGVRTFVQTLVTGLDPQRFESFVACPTLRENAYGDEHFVHFLARSGVPVLPVSMRRSINPRTDIAALLQLIAVIRAGHYDILHLHSSKAGFLGRIAARIVGHKAVVYSPHSPFFLSANSPAKRRFFLELERMAARLGGCIMTSSPGEQAVFLEHRLVDPTSIVCVPNGVPAVAPLPEAARTAMRTALGHSGNGLLIGTVARVASQKNPLLFLDAAARVLQTLPDSRFVWCGGGEMSEQAHAHAEALGISYACRFLGHREDAHAVMAALDVFWLTSNYEGLPIVLLEASSLGLPIVATDVVGTRDYLAGTAGLLVPPGDATALARATVMLAQRPDRRQALARASAAQFAEHGSVNRMLRAIEALYERLVG